MSEQELQRLLLEQGGALLQQRDSLDAATAALVRVSAQLREAREAGEARDRRLDRQIASQERFLVMVEAHQARLSAHAMKLAEHDDVLDVLTQGQAEIQAAQAETADQIAALAAAPADRVTGWRLVALAAAFAAAGGLIAIVGLLAGVAWGGG